MSEYNTNNNGQNYSSVLITGGSGLIGSHLTALLQSAGYRVFHLSRSEGKPGVVPAFFWNPEEDFITPAALDGIDFIIHLAGANLGERRWTKKRKKEIIDSRVKSALLLHKTVTTRGIGIKAFISASAIGIYGSRTSDRIFTENDVSATDFTGEVCREWEQAADHFSESGIRTVKIRTAVVLEKNDSALSKMVKPAKAGFLVMTGDGHQFMPWIHINDLCKIYLKAIEDQKMNGAFNAVAPSYITHREFMAILGTVMNKPVSAVPVPGFLLKIVLGEMANMILYGSRVSPEKIIGMGYKFSYTDLRIALENVLRK